jgi:hypothetical protein
MGKLVYEKNGKILKKDSKNCKIKVIHLGG